MAHNASLVYVKYDKVSDKAKAAVKSAVSKGSGGFATYVPVDGKGEAIVVVRGTEHHDHVAAEVATKQHHDAVKKVGASHGVKALRSAGVRIRSSNVSGPKPFLILLNIEYDPKDGKALRDIGRKIHASGKVPAHVITRDGVNGFVSVAIPVDDPNAHDSSCLASEGLVAELSKLIKSVSCVKLRRVDRLSA